MKLSEAVVEVDRYFDNLDLAVLSYNAESKLPLLYKMLENV